VNKIMTVDEVSEFLQLSPKTIYQYTSNRTLPFIKIGNRVRFDMQDIMKWLEAQKVMPELDDPETLKN